MSNANERILARELLRLTKHTETVLPSVIEMAQDVLAKAVVEQGRHRGIEKVTAQQSPPDATGRDRLRPVIVTRGLVNDICTLLAQQPTVAAQRLVGRAEAQAAYPHDILHAAPDDDVRALHDNLFAQWGEDRCAFKAGHPGDHEAKAATLKWRNLATEDTVRAMDERIAGDQAHDAERRIAQHAEDGFR